MIDTIVLTLQPDQFRIMDHNRFNPSTIGLYQAPYYKLGQRSNFKCVQNPTSEELKNKIYKPRLTVTRRMGNRTFITTMRIEFSIPKLLFSNNFDEVEENQLEAIISRLYKILYDMGVLIMPHVLRNAPVSAVHYSKNIVLADYSMPSAILKELSKINLNLKLDLNQTDFRNEGHSLRFRANSFEISLYDKRKDLQKAKISDKRAIERDNALQLELFDQWKPKGPFEVLRMEIRLNKRVKIKQVFKELSVYSDLTFSSVFKSTIAQKVLLFYLEQIKSGYALLAYQPKSSRDFMAEFKVLNPKAKPRKMLQIFAFKKLLDELGVRDFREAINIYGKHHWPRLQNDLLTHKFPEGSSTPFKVMQQSLNEFKPLRLKDFEQK